MQVFQSIHHSFLQKKFNPCLKERFADVEQRFPKHKNWKNSKKKSTKCRMVFRTTIENEDGPAEILTIVSDVINCTQGRWNQQSAKCIKSNDYGVKNGSLVFLFKIILPHFKPVYSTRGLKNYEHY